MYRLSRIHFLSGFLVLLVGLAACGEAKKDAPPAVNTSQSGDWRAAAEAAASRGATWLSQNAKDGKWTFQPETPPDLGISSLAACAILERGSATEKSNLASTVEWIAGHQKPDGSIYDRDLAVYVTSAAIGVFYALGDGKYQAVLKKAGDYLAMVQEDEGEGKASSSEDYGGVGYGGSGVINMSTTNMAIEAASEAGLAKDHEFYKKALVYLQRSQNLSETNDLKERPKVDGVEISVGNDGGGIYRPAESKAGVAELPGGRKVFRSYGSMTYALLKSYLLCDLDHRDPRVRAAIAWIKDHYELDFNPGMEHTGKPEERYQGLYYYYLTLARCLNQAERARVVLPEEIQNWRQDLAQAINQRQRADGSWSNEQGRWWESSPPLATSYAVLALGECLKAP
ncbi:MAG TPA: terpene cyclase/mutase family protein [Planctomycetota bacterium]|nr:terpene cyclase/mutase family protein [Planctomycetota bacterium]